MTTFTEAKFALDAIAKRTTSNMSQVKQARDILAGVVTNLEAMQTEYTAIVADINAADGADAAWAALKAEKDKLVADFNAVKTAAQAKLTAIDAA
jgi:hypothetical protein